MKAEIITIGDEILIGQIIDTNSSWLGQELSKLGIAVVHRTSVSDNRKAIVDALNAAKQRADIIIMTGGLGPTKDDITKHTLAEYFGSELTLNQEVLDWVTKIFRMRKLPMIDTNRNQALVPSNCEVLFNKTGTAPGMWFDIDGKIFISMPGVPFEMKSIFETHCIPKLQKRFELPVIIHRTILTCNIGESFLAKKIEQLENDLPPHIKLAYLPSVGMVRLRFSGSHTHYATLKNEIDVIIEHLYEIVGEYIYGEENDTLEKNIGLLLKGKNKTVSTAESCTGGYIAHLITSVPGSSAYYHGSIICYANDVKINELGVSPEVLNTVGAVSEACVLQMAQGVRAKLKTDYAIATSGIAGPDGGTAEKPVGTVWIAVSGPSQTIAQQFNMGDNRERTIQRSAIQGLDMLRKMLLAE
ncbi:MAG: competence/damage-inducible protein A [Bacteroidia bacterium]|jgi:nicotinamide-nucleotide amidase|nr:competence/damage-inducible protein A [Bacteroidia bacterium]